MCSMLAMSISPCLLSSTGMTRPFMALLPSSRRTNEEREHGMKLMEYQTKRGGKVVFQDIAKPSSCEWGTPLQSMEAALELEKTVNQSLLDLHKASDGKGDAHLCDFLEAEFLGEQVDGI